MKYYKHTGIVVVTLAIIFLLIGCSTVSAPLMPSESETREKAAFSSLQEVEQAFYWVPLEINVEELGKYGFGPEQAKTTVKPYLKIRGALTGTSQNGEVREKMPKEIENCIADRDECKLFVVEDTQHKRKGVGNVATRFVGFRKVDTHWGHSFVADFVFHGERLVFKALETTSDPNTVTDRKNPLGPLQHLIRYSE